MVNTLTTGRDLHVINHVSDRSIERRSTPPLIVIAVVLGALFGPLDLAGQVHAPYPFANLFNSPAIWAAVAFVFGVWARDTRRAMLGAIVLEVVAVIAYYVTDVVARGSSPSVFMSTRAIAWIVLGIGAGMIFGAAGTVTDDPSRLVRAVGNGLLAGVLLAEASHQIIRHLTTDADSRPDDLVATAIMLIVLAAATLTWLLRGRTVIERAHTLIITVALASTGGIAYTALTG